jgi:hypothetical protein
MSTPCGGISSIEDLFHKLNRLIAAVIGVILWIVDAQAGKMG